jgi:hypothetical protein
MLNLFGNLGKPKEEIEVQQLKKSLEDILVSLQKSIEVVASKNDINQISNHIRWKLKTLNNGYQSLVKKIKIVEHHVKNKELLIGNFNTKVITMSNILGHAKEL